MQQKLKDALRGALGSEVMRVSTLTGGDINDAYRVSLANGADVFVKSNTRAPAGMFQAEARGLRWLDEARALRIPEVIEVGEVEPRFLVLEYLPSARPRANFDVELGRGLAKLHQASAEHFGFDSDNFIGSLPQANASRPSWVEFYTEQRLRPQVRRAVDQGRAPSAWGRRFDALFRALPDFVPEEPPQRLHGDLWGGNLHVGPDGEPCLIDPAVYAGHREVDLAMMRLFGGFSAGVFDAYAEAFPLLAGASQRVKLYQLYPLLVHVNLFGGGYVGSVEAALAGLPST